MPFGSIANFSELCSRNERIKKSDGHLVRWQKPTRLFDRIILPFTDEGDTIADIFGGVFSLGEWCILNKREYLGIEIDREVFELGKSRLERIENGI